MAGEVVRYAEIAGVRKNKRALRLFPKQRVLSRFGGNPSFGTLDKRGNIVILCRAM